MNWHTRYIQQATWTRGLRDYIFDKIELEDLANILEVGCGTGAVLSELPGSIDIHGLDIDAAALTKCRIHVPGVNLVQGDAIKLPYPEDTFDVVYSHFLLLWVRDPLGALQEMKRITRTGGYVIAFAEPNYLKRIDRPSELIPLGKWQTESLIRQGADPSLGARLADLFFRAGIRIIETGIIQGQEQEPSHLEWEIEWDVIELDLTGWIPDREIKKMKHLDREARQDGSRLLHVPTYFAWGQV